VRERWVAFKDARRRQRTEAWLEARDIEPIVEEGVTGP
jgi:hypothetical protein